MLSERGADRDYAVGLRSLVDGGNAKDQRAILAIEGRVSNTLAVESPLIFGLSDLPTNAS